MMERLHIEVLPSIALLTHNNCPTKLTVYNPSNEGKIIKRGCVTGRGTDEFQVIDDHVSSVNVLQDNNYVRELRGRRQKKIVTLDGFFPLTLDPPYP